MNEDIFHCGTRRIPTGWPLALGWFISPRVVALMFAASLLGPVTAGAQATLLFEGFEEAFPGAWSVGDANDEGEEAFWRDVDLNFFGTPPLLTGDWAGYCAGNGFGGSPFGPSYQSDMAASMRRDLDLTGLTGATLSFWYNIPSIESGADYCLVLVGGTVVWSRNSPTAGWQQAVVNLAPYVGAVRTLSFEFLSDFSLEYEGWYLDDILVTTGTALPNLAPHQPAGWSSNIVISTVTGTSTDSTAFTPSDTIYIDWAVINNGPVAVNTSFRTELYVDDVLRTGWNSSPPLNPGIYGFALDYSIGSLSAGSHTIRIRADVNGVVSESNESDNEFRRTITVRGTPDIRISPLALTLNLTNPPAGFAPSGEEPVAIETELAAAQRDPELKLTDAAETLGGFAAGLERVRVKVNLVTPPGALRGADWDSKAKLHGWQAAVKSRQDEVIDALNGAGAVVRHRFENQAGFSVEVTRSALDRVLRHPHVVSVEPVREVKPHLAQGIPLMGAAVYRATYNGSGVSVAIVDNGVDYNHPRLGGGGFPNTKVIGGFDFGDLDGNPAPAGDAHGTASAGIVAGGLGTVGDYIGGVAYNAKIYALKITANGSGSASDDAIIAAWNWCITHKNDDPANPLVAISTGFGGGRFFNPCNVAESAYATAANNANAAGITVLVSSGNEGFCDSLASPSCVSGAIAVGSVFDADYGTVRGCISGASCVPKFPDASCSSGFYAEDDTDADKVPSYSNTASFLGLLAPANRASTTDIVGGGGYSTGDYTTSFGGTSAACPYAAGAVAALQSAARAVLGRFLTAAEVRARLISTGDNITDTKAAVNKPRINVGRAIESLGQSGSFTIYNDGNAPLNVTSLALDAATPWLSWSPPAPFSIGPGSIQVVSISADPALAVFGETVRRLVVTSDDPDESPYPGGVFVTVNKPDARPVLRATRVGSRVVVSWTTNSAGYILYANGTLGAGSWGVVAGTPVIVGGEKFVTNNVTGNGTFYRLQK